MSEKWGMLQERRSLGGTCERAISLELAAPQRAADMQKTTEQPTLAPEAVDGLPADAARAEAWAGEPFLHPEEDPGVVLAPGTARRRALDEALGEIQAGRDKPSYQWKIRFSLMLGLERVLSERPPKLASGTELRRHQIDALAGMLTELIAAVQAQPERDLNGNGLVEGVVEPEEEDELELPADQIEELEDEEPLPADDPGAVRRYRFRHPTASLRRSIAIRLLVGQSAITPSRSRPTPGSPATWAT